MQKKETAKELFLKNGYLLVKNVYQVDDILSAKKLFSSAFKQKIWKSNEYNSEEILNDIYRIFPQLIDVIFNEKYVNAIKSILGEEVVWLPECAVHHNRFINWHKDTTDQEIAGVDSHKTSKESLLQCATYFQTNSKAGGGLTVIPGSHLLQDRFMNLYKNSLFNRLYNKTKKLFRMSTFDNINKFDNVIDIPTEIGDLLIFDVRLDHKSTGDKVAIENGIEKFAIFNTFGEDNNLTKDYLDFLKLRPGPYYEFLQNNTFSDALYKKAASLNIKIWD